MPAVAAVVVSVAPRRAIAAIGLAAAGVSGLARDRARRRRDRRRPTTRSSGDWLVVDATAGLFVGVIGVVGLASALTSPVYLGARRARELVRPERGPRLYYGTFLAFWAVLVAVPLAGNLGIAWLLIEATTAASALLVGFSGRAPALEAGWKYLVLTTLGLGFALLGIVLIAPNVRGRARRALVELARLARHRRRISSRSRSCSSSPAWRRRSAGRRCTTGFRTPTPRRRRPSRLSSRARSCPAVLVVAWRSDQALTPAVGEDMAQGVLVGFGLVSLAVAVPFLWRALAWKRLLAYSSLEHMGVLALGFAFANPLAMAGVVVHVAGHAIAKALGFYAATPLLAHVPAAGRPGGDRGRPHVACARRVDGDLARHARRAAAVAALRQRGPHRRGRLRRRGGPWEAAAAAILLALGFLGLGHALLETIAGKARRRAPGSPRRAAHCRRAHRRRDGCPAHAHRPRAVAAGLGARRGDAGRAA